jgi:hypothetical protein
MHSPYMAMITVRIPFDALLGPRQLAHKAQTKIET